MQSYNVQNLKKHYKLENEQDFDYFLQSLGVSKEVLESFKELEPKIMKLVEYERPIIITEMGEQKDFTIYFGTIKNNDKSYLLTIKDNNIRLATARYQRKSNGVYQYGKITIKSAREVGDKIVQERYGFNLERKDDDKSILTTFATIDKTISTSFTFDVYADNLEAVHICNAISAKLVRELPEMVLLQKEFIVGYNVNVKTKYGFESEVEDITAFEDVKTYRKN